MPRFKPNKATGIQLFEAVRNVSENIKGLDAAHESINKIAICRWAHLRRIWFAEDCKIGTAENQHLNGEVKSGQRISVRVDSKDVQYQFDCEAYSPQCSNGLGSQNCDSSNKQKHYVWHGRREWNNIQSGCRIFLSLCRWWIHYRLQTVFGQKPRRSFYQTIHPLLQIWMAFIEYIIVGFQLIRRVFHDKIFMLEFYRLISTQCQYWQCPIK